MSTLSRGEIHWVDGSYPGNRMNLDRTVSIVDQYAQTIRNWVDSGVIRYALEINSYQYITNTGKKKSHAVAWYLTF